MLKTKKILRLLSIGALVCFIGLFFVAPALAKEKPKGHAVLVVPAGFNMTLGDPHTWLGGAGVIIGFSVHQGLAMPIPGKPTLHWQPALAKSWEFSPDYKTVSFTIDEQAKFHNNAPVTAEDVKFSYERVMSPKFVRHVYNRWLKKTIASIEVKDKYNIVFHLKKQTPLFVDRFGDLISIIPKAYTEKVGDAEFAKHPIGAGPFKWVDGKQDRYVKLEAFEDYFRKVPYVKTLEIKSISESSTALAMLQAGEVDVVMLTPAHIPVVEKDPNLRIMWNKYSWLYSALFVDLRKPNKPSPWHDKRVRQALVYALNHEAICKKILKGSASPYGDIINPYQAGYDLSVKAPVYDPQKARKLLAEAGYPDGFETTIVGTHIMQGSLMAQAVADNLKKVGVKAKINLLEVGTYVRQYHSLKLDGNLSFFSMPFWDGETNPALCLTSLVSSKMPWTYVTTPELEAAYEELCQATDKASTVAKAKKLSKLYRQEMIRAPLWASHSAYGVGPRIESWKRMSGIVYLTGLEYFKLKD